MKKIIELAIQFIDATPRTIGMTNEVRRSPPTPPELIELLRRLRGVPGSTKLTSSSRACHY